MHVPDFDISTNSSNRSQRIFQFTIIILSILLGLLCLAGVIVTSIKWNLSSDLINECQNDTQPIVLCYIRLIINNNLLTQWDRYIMISLLFTYATVFFHIIVESTRTNVSGLLGQMIIQTIFIIAGIGVCFPILFIPSYIYFYKSENKLNKSPVPIHILYTGLIYIVLIIITPTYLIYFLSSNKLIISIMSIILLISPLGFALISLPVRLFSESIQRCWIINSHRLIVYCQIILFILSAPLFFITFVSLIMHWSNELIKKSYVNEISNIINPITIIWSIDYISLFIGLILYLITNEYLLIDSIYLNRSSKIKRLIGWFIFAVIFIISPCLAFPLYIAWKEYQFVELI
ncbi:unnamed protein product [Rotaria sordida]|uniref:Uncharacterized protein n=1 Tax=Rotaria sordida TaxID=392033 RepID=A0A819PAQ1_9BILA|nr:unnamed protein product [Rotaria sordida]CAF1083561.1 unnamed protein product [Rotaria sordida]CAF3640807.1 unnamed protein product [Rotaria sordida]CAF4007578.1 unnamed protein product [Rotaria sordida]